MVLASRGIASRVFHPVAQALVATVLAVVITVGTFWLMRVPVALPR
jgi:hypothetical protein